MVSIKNLALGLAAAAGLVTAAPTTNEANVSGDLTTYDAGSSACGPTYNNGDAIAALSYLEWAKFPETSPSNPNTNLICQKRIRVHYNGKSVNVAVQDKCMGCAVGDVDLPLGQFQSLTGTNTGRFGATWEYLN